MYFEGKKAMMFAARLVKAGYDAVAVGTFVEVRGLSREQQLRYIERKELLILARVYRMMSTYA
jgi:hypothetical protein